MKTSLLIQSTDSNGKLTTKSLTDINPDVSDADLLDFAKDFNAITSNVFKGAQRVNVVDLAEEGDSLG